MKPLVLMLLIGTIVALSDLVGRRNEAKRERAQGPSISAAARGIRQARAEGRLP
jgi:hypothetical protein